MITPRENMLMAYRHEKPYWVPSPSFDQDTCIPSVLEEGPTGLGVTEDGWGVHWLLEPGQPGPMPDESFQRLTDITEWRESLVFPDVEKYDWEAGAAKDTANWDRENKVSACILVNGLFERMHALMGMEDAMCALITDPEESFALLSAIADHKITYLKKIAQYYKPDKIQLHDDYGSGDRTLMSVETWRELIKPNLKKIVDACHELGMIYEHHSCGYIAPLVGDLVELGVDAWNPVQLANDPEALLKQYAGKFTFVGGFDTSNCLDRLDATVEERYDSIMNTLKTLSPYGSWVASGSMMNPTTPAIFMDAMYEFNKPLMEAAGVEAVKHTSVAQSAYETADNIEERKGKK